uniref:Uncharacterized protein n=1 Tax=Zea mays TaxID=4577 RepID=C0P6B3_MAIZE|nr:unknown [Zea mays]
MIQPQKYGANKLPSKGTSSLDHNWGIQWVCQKTQCMLWYGHRQCNIQHKQPVLHTHHNSTIQRARVYLSSPSECAEGIVDTLGDQFGGPPLNKYEHSVYAAPIPTPAPRVTDAQRVVGLRKRRRPAKAPAREE